MHHIAVISNFISFALGFVLNKLSNKAAEKLKEQGNDSNEKLRDAFAEDLNEIKTKIDGLAQKDLHARKDLLASHAFLNEGIATLCFAFDELVRNDKANHDRYGRRSKTTETATRQESESGRLDEAVKLSTAIQKLNDTSNAGRLVDGKKCFKSAHEKATKVFNKDLSLPDRIMATKLRVVSKILECLQDTKAAAKDCMVFLGELNNLPAIGKTFSTYFKGGIKSKVHKDTRLENVKSVLSLNLAVSEFVARYSRELHNITNWPRIHLPTRDETIHTLVIDPYVVKEILETEEFEEPENQLISDKLSFRFYYVINSKRELLQVDKDGNCINIINKSGDVKRFCELRQATANHKGDHQRVTALAIDCDDNVFLIIHFKEKTSNEYVFVLFVYDSTGNEHHERVLHLQFEFRLSIMITLCVVNNDIFIHKNQDNLIYICDGDGNLKSRLPLKQNSSDHSGDGHHFECVTNDDDIVVRTGQNVLVYTKEGELKRTISVEINIKAVRFNYITSKIEVLVEKKSILGTMSYHIYSYSESDEVECLFLPVESNSLLRFLQHPAGVTALMIKNHQNSNTIIFM